MPVFPGIGMQYQPNQELVQFPQQAIQLQQLGIQMRKQNQLMQLNQIPGMVDPGSGLYTDQGMVALSQIDPALRDAAVQKRATVLNLASEARKRQAEEDQIRDKEKVNYADDNIFMPSLGIYYGMKDGTEEQRVAAMTANINKEVDRIKSSGLAAKYGWSDQDLNNMRQWNSPDQIQMALMKHGKNVNDYFGEQAAQKNYRDKKVAENGPQNGGQAATVPMSQIASSDDPIKDLYDQTENFTKPAPVRTDIVGPNTTAKDVQIREGEAGTQIMPPGVGVGGEDKVDFRSKAEEAEANVDRWKAVAEAGGPGAAQATKHAEQAQKDADRYWMRSQSQDRINLAIERAKTTQEPLSPEAISSMARRYNLGEHNVTQGFARNQVAMRQLAEGIVADAKSHGMSDADINQKKLEFAAAGKTVNDFATGLPAKNITALNTAIGHMGLVSDLADALESGNSRTVNKVLQGIGTEFGNKNITNFNVARDAMSDELMRVFRQVGASESETERWQKNFASANTPSQIREGLQTASHLLNSRITSLENQFTRGTRGMFGKYEVLDDQAKAAIDKIDSKTATAGRKATGIPTTGQTSPKSGVMTATNPKTGERIQSNDGGQTWHPMQ